MISLFGAIFLPASYIASIFSMSFFDFTPSGTNDNTASSSSSGKNGGSSVSPLLWIYFAITAPLTLLLVVCWRWWDRRRKRRYAEEDEHIEKDIEMMERQIMATMRKKTMNRLRMEELKPAPRSRKSEWKVGFSFLFPLFLLLLFLFSPSFLPFLLSSLTQASEWARAGWYFLLRGGDDGDYDDDL